MGFYSSDKIILSVNVNTDGILGKLAKIRQLEEELTNETNSLRDMLSVNENTPPNE